MTKASGITIVILSLLLAIVSCNPTPVPRPRSFFRISLPDKAYQAFDTTFPFSFEYPVYANIRCDLSPHAEPYWLNVNIPQFKAQIHISYKKIDNNLAGYLNDTHKLITRHIDKASGIREDLVVNQDEKVFGTIYHISGPGVASSCQFYLTDSTHHFLRGALYFNVIPNNDSLAPVIDFLNKDIRQMVSTLKWK